MTDSGGIVRRSKIGVTAGIAIQLSLIVFGNLTDYGSNFAYVRHTLAMDTTFPDSSIRYRAITMPAAQHVLYGLVIGVEIAATILCWVGVVKMIRHRDEPAFDAAKAPALLGLTTSYLLWQVAIGAIGNEWFGMWMSKDWNGMESIFRTLVVNLGALIYVSRPDPAVAIT